MSPIGREGEAEAHERPARQNGRLYWRVRTGFLRVKCGGGTPQVGRGEGEVRGRWRAGRARPGSDRPDRDVGREGR